MKAQTRQTERLKTRQSLKMFPIGVSVENRQKHRKILNTFLKEKNLREGKCLHLMKKQSKRRFHGAS